MRRSLRGRLARALPDLGLAPIEPAIAALEPLEPRMLLSLMSMIDLSTLAAAGGGDGSAGFVINGVDSYDHSGAAVSSAGDVNGDGFDDFLIGARYSRAANNAKYGAGETYVVFGKASGFAADFDAGSLDGTNGFTLFGADSYDYSGAAVSSAGDVNGDGFGDLIIGAPGANGEGNAHSMAGESYVVFGRADFSATPTISLGSLDGTNGFTMFGVDDYDLSGFAVSGVGDMNGDGFDDVAVGPFHTDGKDNAQSSAGQSWVVFGREDFSVGLDAIELSGLDGTNGITLFGVDNYDDSGQAVSGAGDVNGDGLADLLIGARSTDGAGNGVPNAGESYVVFGREDFSSASVFDLITLDGVSGVTLLGLDSFDATGRAVSGAGDVNGDGIDDLLIGAAYGDAANNAKNGAGDSYVVFGRTDFSAANPLSLGALDGTDGFTIAGAGVGDNSGRALSGAGDVNGDGFDDLLIGAPGADAASDAKNAAGESYIVFGAADFSATPTIDLDALDGADGFVLYGVDAFDYSGASVSGAGDVNGDGFDDLVIGAPYADVVNNATNAAGESYVFFGRDFTASVTHPGTTGNDNLTGDGAANVMIGGRGDDTLVGNGGADVIRGGQGDDRIEIGDLNFLRVDGGRGFDTLVIDIGGGSLSPFQVADAHVSGIERIELGDGGYTVTVDHLSVLLLSDTSDTLILVRGADDTVVLEDNWQRGADELIDGDTFAVYTQGQATLKVSSQGAADTAFELSDLLAANGGDGSAGFVMSGIDEEDFSGGSVFTAGDVNGDGFDDVIIGATGGDPGGQQRAGECYVVFGKAGGFPASLDLATLDGTNGFRIDGVNAYDYVGGQVSAAGDVNGDGFGDLVISANGADPGGNSYAGQTYVVFGKADWSGTPALDLATLDGSNGAMFNGVDPFDFSARSVRGAGDVNGDGFDDLIIGADNADTSDDNDAGQTYVAFGKADWSGTPGVELASLDGTTGFRLDGVSSGDESGDAVSAAGDVNSDGFDDLIVAAEHADVGGQTEAGQVFVVFGKADWSGTPSLPLAALDGSNGFRLDGINAYDHTGASVGRAGDINGDGFDDVVIGAPDADGGVYSYGYLGQSYVVLGKADWTGTPTIDLGALDGSDGFRIDGFDALGYSGNSGVSVNGAGDVNGDGFDDLIIGAADVIGYDYGGQSYVVFGKADWSGAANLDLGTLDGQSGFRLDGIDDYDHAGYSVGSAGDVNGDGFDDLLIGAYGAGPATPYGYRGDRSGETYVVFGGDFTTAVTHPGTDGDDALTGTGGANVMIGGRGNDVFNGLGGADVMHGGQGDDFLKVPNLLFQRLDGGRGFDTVRFNSGAEPIDLGAIPDNRITGIERIELGNGDNTLILNPLEVLNLSDTSNTLTVAGESGDTVQLDGAWSADGSTALAPAAQGPAAGAPRAPAVVFDRYVSGAALLLVQQGVAVQLSSSVPLEPMAAVGQVSGLTHQPKTVYLPHTFTHPVVFVQPASRKQADPAVVRIADIRSDRFTVYIQEADGEDGTHPTGEIANFIVAEEGLWELDDGTLLEVGTLTTNRSTGRSVGVDFEAVSFQTSFGSAPTVVTQVQSNNDAAFVKTRQRGVSATGFQVTLEPAEGNAVKHGFEQVGYIAMEAGTGTWSEHLYESASSANNVTSSFRTISFAQSFTAAPRFIGGMSTQNGFDSAEVRYLSLGAGTVKVKIEEDHSFDGEVGHGNETVSFLAIQGTGVLDARPRARFMGETGQVTGLTHVPVTVMLRRHYDSPVVFAQPIAINGGNPSVVRITDIQDDRFTMFVDESEEQDGFHSVGEIVSYVVLEEGVWELDDGTFVEVDRVTTPRTSGRLLGVNFEVVNFDAPFTAAPALITQVQSFNDTSFVKTRQRNITSTGFQVTMEQEEAATMAHGQETIGYLAIDQANSQWGSHLFESRTTAELFTDKFRNLLFTQTFTAAPNFIGSLSSYHGLDSAEIRYEGFSLDATRIRVRIEEDTSFDAEQFHAVSESVGFLALQGAGLLAANAYAPPAPTGPLFVTINYDLDTNNFFDTQAKRDLLKSAADDIVQRFGDTLDAITPGGSNTWDATFDDPAAGMTTQITDMTVAQNELVIFAGGRALGGTLGVGGPGGFSASGTAGFVDTVATRGQAGAAGMNPTDLGIWGGAITFNTTADWHFGQTTTNLDPGESDFLSVAVHELVHLLGFGTIGSWTTFVSAGNFTGAASMAEYDLGGPVPLSPDMGHWIDGTTDGGNETVMDPTLLVGTRKTLTALDIAALDDIGWEILPGAGAPAPAPTPAAPPTPAAVIAAATMTVPTIAVPVWRSATGVALNSAGPWTAPVALGPVGSVRFRWLDTDESTPASW